MVCLGNDWDEILQDEFKSPYYLQIRQFLKNEYSCLEIYFPFSYYGETNKEMRIKSCL